jgi:glutathione S-transferase
MSAITLYDFSMAPSPRRARILLAEKGVAYTNVQVDMRVNEQLGEAYRRINPSGMLPALRLEDGTLLTDNAAITAWAEARFPDPPLLGVTPIEKAEVASWNWHVDFDGFQAVADALRNGSPAMVNRALPGPVDYAQIPELAERGRQRAQRFFQALDDRLADREFVATDRFSVADIGAVVAVDFARVIRIKPADEHANIRRWRDALMQRPSLAA